MKLEKRIKKLCKHAILAKSRKTMYFRNTAIYCRLKNPIQVGRQYTYAGLCEGSHYSSFDKMKQEVSINEKDIRKCSNREE